MRNFLVLFLTLFVLAQGTCYANKEGSKSMSKIVQTAGRAGTTAALDQLNKYFTITQMPIISGRYWNMTHGHTPEDVVKDLEGMQNLRILARNMAYYLKCIDAGKKAGVELPKQEDVVFTNFIR